MSDLNQIHTALELIVEITLAEVFVIVFLVLVEIFVLVIVTHRELRRFREPW